MIIKKVSSIGIIISLIGITAHSGNTSMYHSRYIDNHRANGKPMTQCHYFVKHFTIRAL